MVACSRGPAYSSLTVRRYSAVRSENVRASFRGAHRPHQRIELPEDPRGRVARGARRGDAIEHAVKLVMLEHAGFVEPLDERAPVVAGRHDAIVLDLDQGLLDRDATDPQADRDLVAVDAVAAAQLARQHQVEDVVDDLVLFFDSVFLRHESLSNLLQLSTSDQRRKVSHVFAHSLRCLPDELSANTN